MDSDLNPRALKGGAGGGGGIGCAITSADCELLEREEETVLSSVPRLGVPAPALSAAAVAAATAAA